jgi:hypothetical protein
LGYFRRSLKFTSGHIYIIIYIIGPLYDLCQCFRLRKPTTVVFQPLVNSQQVRPAGPQTQNAMFLYFLFCNASSSRLASAAIFVFSDEDFVECIHFCEVCTEITTEFLNRSRSHKLRRPFGIHVSNNRSPSSTELSSMA